MNTLVIIALAICLLLAPAVFVVGQFVWHYQHTRGMAYFGRSTAERARFRARLARRGTLLRPMLSMLSAAMRAPNRFAVEACGIFVPGNNCNAETLEQATSYTPTNADVFVVTQMKCGTTWMLQCVYEVLMQGAGDLSDEGHGHLSAVSPWIEAFNGVALDEAPQLGPHGQRVIKTHLSPRLCPYAEEARYIYVTRHPVSCFRSCVDFFETLAGPFCPDRSDMLDWFCSEDMWWGSWGRHVGEAWQWAEEHDNVMFVHFEEMKDDLVAVVQRVADFVDVELEPAALEEVVRRCGFEYMQAHEHQFEMMPPSFFSVDGSFFKRGELHHDEPVTDAERKRIATYCRAALQDSSYPLGVRYADLDNA